MVKAYRHILGSEIPTNAISLLAQDADGYHEYALESLPADYRPVAYAMTIAEEDPNPKHRHEPLQPPERAPDTPPPSLLKQSAPIPLPRRRLSNNTRRNMIWMLEPANNKRPRLTPRLDRIIDRATSRVKPPLRPASLNMARRFTADMAAGPR